MFFEFDRFLTYSKPEICGPKLEIEEEDALCADIND